MANVKEKLTGLAQTIRNVERSVFIISVIALGIALIPKPDASTTAPPTPNPIATPVSPDPNPTPAPFEPKLPLYSLVDSEVDSENKTLERNALIVYANTPDGIRRISNPKTGGDFVNGQEYKGLLDPNNPNNICVTNGATIVRYLTIDQIANISQQIQYASYRPQILQTADQLSYNYFNRIDDPANKNLIKSELSLDNSTDCTQEVNQDLRRGINVNSREYLHIDNYSEKDKTR